MPSFRWCSGIIILLLTISLFSPPAYCQEASIEGLILTSNQTHLVIYLSLADCFSPKLEQAILNGLPATFRFYINVYKKRSFWYDKALESTEISHSIEYDLLKKEFHVILEEKQQTNHTTEDFEEAKRLMADVDRFSIIHLGRLEKNQQYYLRIMARMVPLRLPFYLDLFSFILPKWEFETDWIEKDFVY